jgi:hypothetical protein
MPLQREWNLLVKGMLKRFMKTREEKAFPCNRDWAALHGIAHPRTRPFICQPPAPLPPVVLSLSRTLWLSLAFTLELSLSCARRDFAAN